MASSSSSSHGFQTLEEEEVEPEEGNNTAALHVHDQDDEEHEVTKKTLEMSRGDLGSSGKPAPPPTKTQQQQAEIGASSPTSHQTHDDTGTCTPPTRRREEEAHAPPRAQGCQNVGFTVLFVLHFGVLALIYYSESNTNSTTKSNVDAGRRFFEMGALVILLSSVFAILWTLVLLAPDYSTSRFLRGAHLASTILWVTVAALLFKNHVNWFFGTFCLLVAVGDTLWMVHSRQRLKFTVTFLDIISDSYASYRRLTGLGGILLLLQTLYLLIWLRTCVLVVESGKTSARMVFAVMYLLLSLRWTTGVIQLIYSAFTSAYYGYMIERYAAQSMDGQHLPVHSLDGVRGAQQVSSDEEWRDTEEEAKDEGEQLETNQEQYFPNDGSEADLRALRYSLTSSFGSMAAGSLAGFVTPLLWAVLRVFRGLTSRSRREWVQQCSSKAFRWIEHWIRLSQRYTIVLVASRQLPWFKAAKKTWKALVSNGTQAVVADDCTGRLLQFSCYLCGLVGVLLGMIIQPSLMDKPFFLLLLFVFGFVCMALPLAVFTGPVKTVIVFYSLKPDVVAQWHTVVFHRFVRLSETHQVRFQEDSSTSWMENAVW